MPQKQLLVGFPARCQTNRIVMGDSLAGAAGGLAHPRNGKKRGENQRSRQQLHLRSLHGASPVWIGVGLDRGWSFASHHCDPRNRDPPPKHAPVSWTPLPPCMLPPVCITTLSAYMRFPSTIFCCPFQHPSGPPSEPHGQAGSTSTARAKVFDRTEDRAGSALRNAKDSGRTAPGRIRLPEAAGTPAATCHRRCSGYRTAGQRARMATSSPHPGQAVVSWCGSCCWR